METNATELERRIEVLETLLGKIITVLFSVCWGKSEETRQLEKMRQQLRKQEAPDE